jgi:hypothetical protein
MVTRDYRISEFRHDEPPSRQALQLLCEDHNGTYLLPFKCEYRDGAWYNLNSTAQPLQVKIIGWRPWRV